MGLGNVAAQPHASGEPEASPSGLTAAQFDALAQRVERDGAESLTPEERERYDEALELLQGTLQRALAPLAQQTLRPAAHAAGRYLAPMVGRLAGSARRELMARRYARRRPAPWRHRRGGPRARRTRSTSRGRARSPGSSEPEPDPHSLAPAGGRRP